MSVMSEGLLWRWPIHPLTPRSCHIFFFFLINKERLNYSTVAIAWVQYLYMYPSVGP